LLPLCPGAELEAEEELKWQAEHDKHAAAAADRRSSKLPEIDERHDEKQDEKQDGAVDGGGDEHGHAVTEGTDLLRYSALIVYSLL
jgi:hypothetical protein